MDEFNELFDNCRKEAFRLETRNFYDPPGEATLLKAYLEGEPLPPEPGNPDWINYLQNSKQVGRQVIRVRCYPKDLSAYLRFELEWAFLYFLKAGEDIRILNTENPSELFASNTSTDFWLFDSEAVAILNFSDSGSFKGTEILRGSNVVQPFLEVRRRALKNTENLESYLARIRQA